MVQAERGYRWIGIYKIQRGDFVIAAATGKEPPTYPRFPKTQGLCGAVAETGQTLIVGDVTQGSALAAGFLDDELRDCGADVL